MKPPTDTLASSSAPPWSERAGRLYVELKTPAITMVRRAFGTAFGAEELEDIYSGAWVGTLRTLATRHQRMSDEEIRKYVFAAVANQAGKEIRRRRRKPTASLELVDAVAEPGDTPAERAEVAASSRVTRDLLLSLPPRRRAVMLLRYGWGLEPDQVRGLVKGLSARAYRKEITRGVDELTERVRRFQAGRWCEDREPVLKALASGLAGEDEERQARAHLSHCRECSDFVARLNGHLHDLSGAAIVPASVEALDGAVLGERVKGLAERAKDAALGLIDRGGGDAGQELALRTFASGGTRGAGAAGAGVLAKLAGLGSAGKLAVACLGGGAAATACVAAGLGPTLGGSGPGRGGEDREPGLEQAAVRQSAGVPPADVLPSQLGQAEVTPSASAAAGAGDSTGHAGTSPAGSAVAPTDPSPSVVAPSAPADQQEFGAPAAAAAPSGSSAPPSGGDGGAAAQEFAP